MKVLERVNSLSAGQPIETGNSPSSTGSTSRHRLAGVWQAETRSK